jgi:hypothetical protein
MKSLFYSLFIAFHANRGMTNVTTNATQLRRYIILIIRYLYIKSWCYILVQIKALLSLKSVL